MEVALEVLRTLQALSIEPEEPAGRCRVRQWWYVSDAWVVSTERAARLWDVPETPVPGLLARFRERPPALERLTYVGKLPLAGEDVILFGTLADRAFPVRARALAVLRWAPDYAVWRAYYDPDTLGVLAVTAGRRLVGAFAPLVVEV